MYRQILVLLDGGITAAHGLTEAIALAHMTHGRLRLIHVIDDLSSAVGREAYSGYGGGNWLNVMRENGAHMLRQNKSRVEAADLEVDTVLYDSFSLTLQEIVAAEVQKWPADLIVLGTHGRRGISQFVMGSDAERILLHSTVPVLVVRELNVLSAAPLTSIGV